MAWVQVGKRKINTATVCFIEDMGNGVQVWFQNTKTPLELHFDEAKAFWKHLKAEDAMGSKSAHQVLTKSASSGEVLDVKIDDDHDAKAAKAKSPVIPGMKAAPK
jgi:hypothetical protein